MYIDLPAEPLVIEVSDRLIDDTLFKQKATFTTVAITRDASNETEVSLNWRVDLFSSVAGEYGKQITGFGIGSYPVNVRADNTCGVYFNPEEPTHERTGEIVLNRGYMTDAEFVAAMQAHPEPLAKQGRFYALLMKYPQAMESQIINECRRADSPAHNKFGATLPEPVAAAIKASKAA